MIPKLDNNYRIFSDEHNFTLQRKTIHKKSQEKTGGLKRPQISGRASGAGRTCLSYCPLAPDRPYALR